MRSSLTRTFEGISNHNDFTEALQAALSQAQQALAPDTLFSWELVTINGQQGGVHGQHQITVAIRLVGSVTRRRTNETKTPRNDIPAAKRSAMAVKAFAAATKEQATAPTVINLDSTTGTDVLVAIAFSDNNGSSSVNKKNSPTPVADGDYHSVGSAPSTHVYQFTFYQRPWEASFEALAGDGSPKREDRSDLGTADLMEPDVWSVILHVNVQNHG